MRFVPKCIWEFVVIEPFDRHAWSVRQESSTALERAQATFQDYCYLTNEVNAIDVIVLIPADMDRHVFGQFR